LPYFTLQVSQGGPILNAFVGVSQARGAALAAEEKPLPNPVKIRALVDTGASTTCVDPSVLISALGLTPTGAVLVNTPSTGDIPHNAFQYDVSLIVPPAIATHAPLVVPNLGVISAPLFQAQGFHALIGRDVLSLCYLTCDGLTGFFTLAY
jgi:hypothetical protein